MNFGLKTKQKNGSTRNPYLPGYRAWDDVNGFAIAQMRRAYAFAYVCAFLAVIGFAGMVYYASQPRLIPYIVQVDRLDQQLAVARADQLVSAQQAPEIVRAVIRQFVMNLRMVTFDPIFQKHAVTDGVKPFVALHSQAEATIHTFYLANDPFKRARENSVDVGVTSVVPMSPTTFQVDWTETAHDSQGQQLSQQHWRGFYTIVMHQFGTEDSIIRNPAGVYITNIQWNQVDSGS